MKTRRLIVPLGAALAAISLAASAHAQSIDSRARADGTYRFSYRARPGVCGDGAATIYINDARGGRSRIQVRGDSWNTTTSRYSDEWQSLCVSGPVRIAFTREAGEVVSLRTYVGGEWRASSSATDLGRINTRDAANFLLDIAERSGPAVGREAMFAATIADSTDTWRRLLALARNQNAVRKVRQNAIFWLGQEAAAAATAGLKEIIDSEDDLQVREHAVFALSQQPAETSVPALITLVKKPGVDPRIKRTALFWLSQKEDPRALALFEELLTK